MSEIKEKLKNFWNWVKSLFITYYKLDVSYNHTWGDADDQTFIVKKFHKKQEKFLSFTTQEGELVEIRGAEGLNYRITEL
jgi:hypothetical protein